MLGGWTGVRSLPHPKMSKALGAIFALPKVKFKVKKRKSASHNRKAVAACCARCAPVKKITLRAEALRVIVSGGARTEKLPKMINFPL